MINPPVIRTASIEVLDYEALEHAGGVQFDDATRETLKHRAQQYLIDRAKEADIPNTRPVRTDLEAIEKHAAELGRLLTDPEKLPSASAAGPDCVEDEQALVDLLNRTRKRANAAQGNLTENSKGGRRPQKARRAMLADLHSIWQQSGGVGRGIYWNDIEGCYCGHFRDLAEQFVTELKEHEPRVDFYGLDKAVLSATKDG